ncbi:hypothetical protein BC826DRAFT_619848 [Russula brevipes]|nr:hypothetical protein BC826DRAFT_619848 [Russula brevipes]
MAGALRKVSRNYNWTLKRADNDLHNAITPRPQTSTPSASSQEVKSVDISLFPWDSNRVQWKFRTEYEELREHLDHSLLILLSWMVTLDPFLRVAMRHFIKDPVGSSFRFYEEIVKLGILPTSIWSLWVTLFRSVFRLMVSLLWDFFSGFSFRIYVGISDEDETDAAPASRLAGQPVIVEVPVEGPDELDAAQAPAKDAGNTTSGAAPSPSPALLTETKAHSSTHDQAERLSPRKSPSDSTGSRHQYAKTATGTHAAY